MPIRTLIVTLRRMVPVALLLLLAGCVVQPDPLTQPEIKRRVDTDLGRLFADQEPVTSRIGLFEAMARAVKYNLERRVKQMEEAVSRGELDLAQRELLPQLTTSAGYTVRDNDPSSSSDGSALPSTAQERGQGLADLTLAWSVLDFGVSYVQAQQQADRVLIAGEQRRKSTQNILQDVRVAYWRAATADLLLPAMDDLLTETRSALERSRQMERARVQAPMKSLEYQQALLETTQQLWSLRKELTLAKSEFAALINLPPGTPFRLQTVAAEMIDDRVVDLPREALENHALMHRPELREEDYQERINAREVRKILLRMLPGLDLTGSLQHDSNKYLLNQSWANAGLQLSWNLFNWVSTPRALAAARLQTDLSRTRRLAFGMAVLTQLQLALQGYHLSNRDLTISQELNRVLDQKMQHARFAKKAAKGHEMDEIRVKSEALFARMRQGLAFAELQGALGRIHVTLGLDPLPLTPTVEMADLDGMAQIIASRQTNAATAIVSDIANHKILLPTGTPPEFIFPETDTASLEKDDSARFWGTLEQFSSVLSSTPVARPVVQPMVPSTPALQPTATVAVDRATIHAPPDQPLSHHRPTVEQSTGVDGEWPDTEPPLEGESVGLSAD